MVCAMQAMPPMGNGVDRTLVAAGQETRARCPTLIAAIAGDLEDGHACTLQIVSTNEALLDRRLGAEEWTAVEDGTEDRGAALLCGWHEEPQAPGNDLGYETQRLELANGAEEPVSSTRCAPVTSERRTCVMVAVDVAGEGAAGPGGSEHLHVGAARRCAMPGAPRPSAARP